VWRGYASFAYFVEFALLKQIRAAQDQAAKDEAAQNTASQNKAADDEPAQDEEEPVDLVI
jgi:hypothetical protein